MDKKGKLAVGGLLVAGGLGASLLIYEISKSTKNDEETTTDDAVTPPPPTGDNRIAVDYFFVSRQQGCWFVGIYVVEGIQIIKEFPWTIGYTNRIVDLENFLYQFSNGGTILTWLRAQSGTRRYLSNINESKIIQDVNGSWDNFTVIDPDSMLC